MKSFVKRDDISSSCTEQYDQQSSHNKLSSHNGPFMFPVPPFLSLLINNISFCVSRHFLSSAPSLNMNFMKIFNLKLLVNLFMSSQYIIYLASLSLYVLTLSYMVNYIPNSQVFSYL
jgi:hypothetical protein